MAMDMQINKFDSKGVMIFRKTRYTFNVIGRNLYTFSIVIFLS